MADLLNGKIALITGGSTGIGRAAALAFAREGASIAVADVNIAGGEETVAHVKAAGGDAMFRRCDVSRLPDVEALIRAVVDRYGRIDCAFNNAGVSGVVGGTVDCTEENWDRTVAVNLKGVWACMKYEIPALKEAGGGAIVNTSSLAGGTGLAGWPAYVASKHGIVGLTRTAAVEHAADLIRVNTILPGGVATEMARGFGVDVDVAIDPASPGIGRLALPEEIAESVVWLCSDGARHVSGQAIVVDAGASAGIGGRR